MIAVLFEVWPKPDGEEAYLKMAGTLRPLLESSPGFISIERFRSMAAKGKLLSLSFFEDEASVIAWRNLMEHRKAQAAGRNGYFADYRIRIASVERDYGMLSREQAPADSRDHHTEAG